MAETTLDNDQLVDVVAAIQQGDDQASHRLYTSFIDPLYAYFFYRCYDKMTAEDLTSTTFLAVFEQIDSFDPARSTNVKGWIYRIAHNKLVDHRRANKMTPLQFDEDRQATDYHPDILEHTNAKVIVERLGELLDEMHPAAKQIVLMKIWEDMSHTEIANELELEESNVRKIFSRSMKKLAEQGEGLLLFYLLVLCAGG